MGKQGQAVDVSSWQVVTCSRSHVDANIFRRGGINLFPLYVYPDPRKFTQHTDWPSGPKGREPNLNPEFVHDIEERLGLEFVSDGLGDLKKTFGPEDVFYYAYAMFHSPTYRERYAEFLRIDFPRLPLTSDNKMFKRLVEKGAELVGLHLLEAKAVNKLITVFPEADGNVVERGYPKYTEPSDDRPGRVYINKTQYFEGIEPEVWEFHIGGYQVLHKWLKDRRERELSWDDIQHYQRVVVALRETMRLMDEIDSVIPSWPLK